MPRMFKTALIFSIFALLPLRFALAATILDSLEGANYWTETDDSTSGFGAALNIVTAENGVNPTDPTHMLNASCEDCQNFMKLTWQPLTPVTVTGSYLGMDAYSYALETNGHAFIVYPVTGEAITLSMNNTSCNTSVAYGGSCSPDGILTRNMWETLFTPLAGVTAISKVEILLKMTGAPQTIYLDFLRDFTSQPVCANPTYVCTPVPTSTFTNTVSPTNTFSPSPTFTKTSTPTDTPTPTMTSTPTNTPTSSFTSTNTATPTNTSTFTNTSTNTQTWTITNTFSPTSTFTSSLTPTTTSTETMTRTPTGTPTPSLTSTNTGTWTNTPQFTTTHTDTFTNTPTSTSTLTPTRTSTSTNTFTATVTSTNTMTSTPTDTPLFTYTITNTSTLTVTSTSTLTSTSTVTSTTTPTNTASNTSTFTWTATPSNTATVTNTATPTLTLTWTNTRTVTFTPTITNTPPPPTNTATVTATPWPLWVFPNPIDFQQTGVDASNQTIDYDCHLGPGSPLFGCVKFNGVEKGSTLKIYTVALTHVRTFRANDGYLMVPGSLNPNVVQITWDGTNEDRNPVAAGMYFYVMDGGPSGKHIGKLAIKGARK